MLNINILSCFFSKLKFYEEILIIVGFFYISKFFLLFIWKLLEWCRTFAFPRFFQTNLKKCGQWALITGSTDGIGKAYARELASRGFNIILMSRNLERLSATSRELEESFGVETFFIQADFKLGRKIYRSIEKQLKDKEIGILVNNVGVSYEKPIPFMDVSEETLWSLINVNVVSVLMMSRIVLPQMLARKCGYIVNVSSLASLHPLPLMNVYSASKVFIDWFSRALGYEYRDRGIVVQTLIPSYVSTSLVKHSTFLSKPSIVSPAADIYCRSAVATLGVINRTTGYWFHEIQYFFCDTLPVWLWYVSSWHLQNSIYDRRCK